MRQDMEDRRLSILGRAKPEDVVLQPFPHLIVKNALEPEVYEQLAAEFPHEAVVSKPTQTDNAYHFMNSNEAHTHPQVSDLWRRFQAYHTSTAFFREVVGLFGDEIRKIYPQLEVWNGKRLEEFVGAPRFTDEAETADTRMECQFAVVTSTDRKVSPKGPHVDRPRALYAGLLYFRLDEDDSEGGDLELLRFKDIPSFPPGSKDVSREVAERFAKARYEANTLAFLIHSPHSLHAVTPRSANAPPRRHINFVAEFPRPLYDLAAFSPGAADHAQPGLVRRIRSAPLLRRVLS